MAGSRLKPLTVKEIEKLVAVPPNCIKHRYLGGVPGFTLVHTPAGYTGYGLIYRAGGKRKKLTLGSTKRLTLGDARKLAGRFRSEIEAVYINGAPVIPVGTTAWGEIASVEGNGAVGKGGRLGARLLYVDLPSGPIPLRGEANDRGGGNGAGVVLGVVGFGLLGLLTGGDSARLKAGDLFTAYVDRVPDTEVADSTGGAASSGGSQDITEAAGVAPSDIQVR